MRVIPVKLVLLMMTPLPKKYNPQQAYVFSGKRVKRGLYRSRTGILINVNVNGAYNILRKSKPKFGISHLPKDGLEGWLHPCKQTVD